MTTLAQEVLLPGLRITEAQAARMLMVSRGRLAEFILGGRLQRVDPGGLLLQHEVQALLDERTPPGGFSDRTRFPQGRLDRVQDKIVWLLHDWGGAGTNLELRVALTLTGAPVTRALTLLRDRGFVSRRRDGWQLTSAGWEYTRRFEPPV